MSLGARCIDAAQAGCRGALNGSNSQLLEEMLTLIDPSVSVDAEALADIMELHERRQNYQAVADTAARVPGLLTSKMRATLATAAAQSGNVSESLSHLRLLPSDGKGRPCLVSSSTAVKFLGLAAEEGVLAEAAAELPRLHATLDPKHVDNLVRAVAQKGGSQMIRDLVAACETLSENFTLRGVRRHRRGARRPS